MIGTIAKAVAAAVSAGLTAAIAALVDNTISPVEWTVIVGAVLANLGGVWAIPNLPAGVAQYAKAITAGLLQAAAAVGLAVADTGVSSAEWLTILLALAAGSGLVATVPNAQRSDDYEPASDDAIAYGH